MNKPTADAHWRDSARPVRFFIWDCQAVFPMVLFLMHMRLWTLIVAVAITFFFTILNRFGFSLMIFGRWLRSFFAGKRKISTPWWMN